MSTQGTFERTESLLITDGLNVVGFVSRWKRRKKVCVAGTIPKFQKKIIMVFLCVFTCV